VGDQVSTLYRCYVLGVLFLVAVCNMMDRLILSILQESISREFGLTDFEWSRLSWFFSLAFLAFGLPLARCGDLYSRRTIVVICLSIWSAMTACCGLERFSTSCSR
jgi:MFS family permease